jgi:hypothetical protein
MEGLGSVARRTRNVRVEDDLWNAAQQAAQERGENVAVVIRRALIAYVAADREPRTSSTTAAGSVRAEV